MKLAQLKAMVLHWQHSKSIMTAYDICQFLCENLNLEEYHETICGEGEE